MSSASRWVSVGNSVKHIASAAMPAPARCPITSDTTATGAPLSISPSTRSDPDSTPSAHATAPASRSVSARSRVRYLSGLRSVAQRMSSPAATIACESFTRFFGATGSCEK